MYLGSDEVQGYPVGGGCGFVAAGIAFGDRSSSWIGRRQRRGRVEGRL
jgi:hypothetical protein